MVDIVRQGLTKLTTDLKPYFSTDAVIEEVMVRRKYINSPYREKIEQTLREVGVFKFEHISDMLLICPEITEEQLKLYGLVDRSGGFLLKNRYIIPIRDIKNQVTAWVGWYPDDRKYITTPTYGFSKDTQFFNIECFKKSIQGDYPKYIDEDGNQYDSKGIVYLVEGIFDTLMLRALGFPSLGNMGLDLSLVKAEILTRFGKVIIIHDNDNAGKSTNKYKSTLSTKGSKKTIWVVFNDNVLVSLPRGIKDIDDLIVGYFCEEDLLKCQIAKYQYTLHIN